jgi:hypothetical protein
VCLSSLFLSEGSALATPPSPLPQPEFPLDSWMVYAVAEGGGKRLQRISYRFQVPDSPHNLCVCKSAPPRVPMLSRLPRHVEMKKKKARLIIFDTPPSSSTPRSSHFQAWCGLSRLLDRRAA